MSIATGLLKNRNPVAFMLFHYRGIFLQATAMRKFPIHHGRQNFDVGDITGLHVEQVLCKSIFNIMHLWLCCESIVTEYSQFNCGMDHSDNDPQDFSSKIGLTFRRFAFHIFAQSWIQFSEPGGWHDETMVEEESSFDCHCPGWGGLRSRAGLAPVESINE